MWNFPVFLFALIGAIHLDAQINLPTHFVPLTPSCAVCCPPNGRLLCSDFTLGTPCCGYHRCNFFCCNCGDKGCRGTHEKRNFRKRDLRQLLPKSNGFELIDKNNDGYVEKHEAYAYLMKGGSGNYLEKIHNLDEAFTKLDMDGDAKLNYHEINSGD